jgi:hypothetical protein
MFIGIKTGLQGSRHSTSPPLSCVRPEALDFTAPYVTSLRITFLAGFYLVGWYYSQFPEAFVRGTDRSPLRFKKN